MLAACRVNQTGNVFFSKADSLDSYLCHQPLEICATIPVLKQYYSVVVSRGAGGDGNGNYF